MNLNSQIELHQMGMAVCCSSCETIFSVGMSFDRPGMEVWYWRYEQVSDTSLFHDIH